METALYGPRGFYTHGGGPGGDRADFFTSPELTPVFGALIGRQIYSLWLAMGRPRRFDIVEHGPGTGSLCLDILDWAWHERRDFWGTIRYRLVEISPALRRRQRARLGELGAAAAGRVGWRSPRSVRGCILANELLDALPVHLVTIRDGALLERFVEWATEGPRLVGAAPSEPAIAAHFERLGVWPAEGCHAEVCLAAVPWIESAAASLEAGQLLILDYGYEAAELYAPTRRHGTMLCYRRHTLGSDPLVHIGEQDITAHVDFTSVRRAGEASGLRTAWHTDQATFLDALGLGRYRRLAGGGSVTGHATLRAIGDLADPAGLGRIRALVQTRGLPDFDPLVAATRVPPPSWLPPPRGGGFRLPSPESLDGIGDIEAEWRRMWEPNEPE
jgi:SAM-dependent MidA family methyltransferase